ncbi:hypothetical protein [Halogeometricum limi]|uniref:DUF7979 domain-containing protein n=1 Tax=Halogeometricum limi TaxID=555875 RepID=A0A1I6HE81_9EURY|nr:hypothetical protein [Halogeometricum limi]SFR52684.1 hypothetical protein SAMN04488124_2120 [Halogeometricum limi]
MSRTARGSRHDESTADVTVVRTGAADIDPDATVRHYDQLSERGQRAVAAAAESERGRVRDAELSVGEVVRFTDYYVVR